MVLLSIDQLTKEKECTAFLDGDRGGRMILNELIQVANVKYYAFAPDNREVEELTAKEIVKALKNKRLIEDYKKDKLDSENRKNLLCVNRIWFP